MTVGVDGPRPSRLLSFFNSGLLALRVKPLLKASHSISILEAVAASS